jgi:hypothetical protein
MSRESEVVASEIKTYAKLEMKSGIQPSLFVCGGDRFDDHCGCAKNPGNNIF